MIISPKIIFERGIIDCKYGAFSEKQFDQPNGIDVRVRKAWQLLGSLTIREDIGGDEKKSLPLHDEVCIQNNDDFFYFRAGTSYSIECFESVKIPEGMAAMVYGRSTFNRNGVFIRSSFYDSGFSNIVGFTLYPFIDCFVGFGTRVAQIVFFEADGDGVYKGQYQNDVKFK